MDGVGFSNGIHTRSAILNGPGSSRLGSYYSVLESTIVI